MHISKCKHINTNINQLKLMKTMCLLIRLDEIILMVIHLLELRHYLIIKFRFSRLVN